MKHEFRHSIRQHNHVVATARRHPALQQVHLPQSAVCCNAQARLFVEVTVLLSQVLGYYRANYMRGCGAGQSPPAAQDDSIVNALLFQ